MGQKTVFPCKFVIPGFNTGRGRREYKCGCTVAQGIPLRIGYVERIAPGLTNR
jgi:hypothetical protein